MTSTSEATSTASSPNSRVVLYLSGGGYRAALASAGALAAIGALGMWSNVRKIVSVSGGGIANGWLLKQQPSTDQQLLASVDALIARLLNRRRSLRNVAIATVTSACSVIAILALCFGSFAFGSLPWIVVPGGLLLIAWSTLWLAPRVFLACDYSFLGRDRGSVLRGSSWHREHVFVASDLLAAGPVSFFCHRQGALVDISRRGVFNADRVRLTAMLRASTALPPLLPAVRVAIGASALGTARRTSVSALKGRGVWLVDGGVTGNLGIQTDGSLTDDLRRSDDEVRAARTAAARYALLKDRLDEMLASFGSVLDASSRVDAHRARSADDIAFGQSDVADAAMKLFMEDPDNTDVLTAAWNAFGSGPREANEAQEALSRAFDAYAVNHGYKAHSFWADADDVAAVVKTAGIPRELGPNCDHAPIAWSICEECKTSVVVVDASGSEPRPTRFLRAAMWIPGLATLVNAIQTIRTQYSQSLVGDRSAARQFLVSATSPSGIYRREARVDRAKSAFARRLRWMLADDILPATASLIPPREFLRAEAARAASEMPTTLTAPREDAEQFSARATFASGFFNTYVQLSPDASIDEILHNAEKSLPAFQLNLVRTFERSAAERAAALHDSSVDFRTAFLRFARAEYAQHLAEAAQEASVDRSYREYGDAMSAEARASASERWRAQQRSEGDAD